jgi:pimeloyl-ACP methyl ester carboxylesterase
MPQVHVNGIDIDYLIEGSGPETIVMVNGLADEKESWGFQTPDFLAAGHRVLTFDNRGVGKSSMPPGPYTTRLFGQDTKALVDALGVTGFHMVGTSMGGMIAQEYAIAHGDDLKSLTLSSTYGAPGPFCSRMFAMWADMAPVMGVPFVMRDVTLFAFTLPFFETRGVELHEFEAAMASMSQPVEAYLRSQLHPDPRHDRPP